jgi:hypothetical protein
MRAETEILVTIIETTEYPLPFKSINAFTDHAKAPGVFEQGSEF